MYMALSQNKNITLPHSTLPHSTPPLPSKASIHLTLHYTIETTKGKRNVDVERWRETIERLRENWEENHKIVSHKNNCERFEKLTKWKNKFLPCLGNDLNSDDAFPTDIFLFKQETNELYAYMHEFHLKFKQDH